MKRNPFLRLVLASAVAAVFSACSPAKDDKPPAPKVSENTGAATHNVAASAAAAGKSAGGETSHAHAGGATGAIAALPRLGPAPVFKLMDLDGKVVSSEQMKGKVVVVDFWATWCPPCRVEIPGYVELQKKYGKDGLMIVGVSLDQGGPEVVKPFAAKTGINYTMLMADEAVLGAFGGVEAIPTTFLIDRSGNIRDRKVGAEETADYEKKIVAVLGEKA